MRTTGVVPQRVLLATAKQNVDVAYQLGALRSAKALGACAVFASLSALWLYFSGFGDRRRRDRVIARMLGLSRRGDLAANLAEIVPLIVSGVVLAIGLSWLTLRITLRSLDVNVSTPPPPFLRFATSTSVLFAVAAVAGAVVLAVTLARSTVRTNIVGALRDAD